MWTTKRFKTQAALDNFISKNEGKMRYNVIYINNGYGVEFKKLVTI
jgi:hypothetical protein